jgi:hypothetical protein
MPPAKNQAELLGGIPDPNYNIPPLAFSGLCPSHNANAFGPSPRVPIFLVSALIKSPSPRSQDKLLTVS